MTIMINYTKSFNIIQIIIKVVNIWTYFFQKRKQFLELYEIMKKLGFILN